MTRPQKKSKQSKSNYNESILTLYNNYSHTLLVRSKGMPANGIHLLREELRSTSKILFGKQKPLIKALESITPNMKSLTSKFKEHCFLIFTNDPKLKENLKEIPIMDYIRAGHKLNQKIIFNKGVLDMQKKNLDIYLRELNVMCSLKDGKVFLEEELEIEGEVSVRDAKILKILGVRCLNVEMQILEVIKNNK